MFPTVPRAARTNLRSKMHQNKKNPPKTPGGFLSKLFITLLEKRIGISTAGVEEEATLHEKWNTLLLAYLKDPRNGIPQNSKSLSSERGNLTKEIIKPEMSWKVFVKGLRLLQVTKIEFDFKVHLYNGAVIKHSDDLNITNTYFTDVEEETKDGIPPSTVPDDILG